MDPEVSFQKQLYDIFSEFYTEQAARKLARAHADSHEVFVNQLGIGCSLFRKAGELQRHKRKRPIRLRVMETMPIDLDDVIGPNTRVSQETIDEEILSFMRSVGATHTPVRIAQILDALCAFEWNDSQVRRAIRRLEKTRVIERDGEFRSAGYLLPLDADVPAGVEAQRLEAGEPTYR